MEADQSTSQIRSKHLHRSYSPNKQISAQQTFADFRRFAPPMVFWFVGDDSAIQPYCNLTIRFGSKPVATLMFSTTRCGTSVQFVCFEAIMFQMPELTFTRIALYSLISFSDCRYPVKKLTEDKLSSAARILRIQTEICALNCAVIGSKESYVECSLTALHRNLHSIQISNLHNL